jgi:hypothetical protein
MKMFKKNGKVGVIISTGFGAGFSTWNDRNMAIDFDLVEAFLKGDMTRFKYIADEKYGDWYDGGTVSLKVEWVPEGSRFMIEEYDGRESLVILDDANTFIAQ